MAGQLQPLDSKFAITNPDGTPTDYFTRWAQDRQLNISSAVSTSQLAAFFSSHLLVAGTGIDISPDGNLTNSPTISIANTAVVPGTYGDAANVPQITVDQQGRITGVVDVPIPGGGGGGTVTTTGAPATGALTVFSGPTSITDGDLSGDITTGGSLVTALSATGVTAGTYGDATHVCHITFDAKGRATVASAVAIVLPAGSITGLGYFATGTDAANLTGTISAARLPAFAGGDVTSPAGSVVLTIGANKVTRAMMAATAGATILGATGAGNVTDLTAAQAKTFLAIVAADVGGLGYFATGTNAANLTGTIAAAQLPAFAGGDVTSPAGSVVLTIGNAKVTYPKIQNVAASSLIGNATGGAAAPTDIGLSSSAFTFSGTTLYSAVDHPDYVSPFWYCTIPEVTLGAGVTFTANTIKLLPFTVSKPITVSDLAAHVTTVSAGNSFQLAIYAHSNATSRPTGNALCFTGNISTASAAAPTSGAVNANTLLNPGIYWMAINQNNGVAVYKTLAQATVHAGYLVGSATLANVSSGAGVSSLVLSFAQAFNTWPDLTGVTFVEQNTAASAVVFMKAA